MTWLETLQETLSGDLLRVLISAAGGILAAMASNFIFRHFAVKQSRTKTEQEQFEAAIASDHLPTLGTYLRKQLGEVDLRAYLNDSTARSRVNQYLRRLEEFVQPPTEEAAPSKEKLIPKPASDQATGFVQFPDDPPSVASAVNRIRDGEIWTGLAGLRRDLEKRLTASMQPSEARRGPPYKDIQDPGVRDATRRFWYLASRAIHGDELSEDEAWTAVNLAREIYHFLDREVQSRPN